MWGLTYNFLLVLRNQLLGPETVPPCRRPPLPPTWLNFHQVGDRGGAQLRDSATPPSSQPTHCSSLPPDRCRMRPSQVFRRLAFPWSRAQPLFEFLLDG